jgi:hypothetical protein
VSCVFLERSNCDSWLFERYKEVRCVLFHRFISFSLFDCASSFLRLVYSSRRSSVRPLFDTSSLVSGLGLIIGLLWAHYTAIPTVIASPLSSSSHLRILLIILSSNSLPPLSFYFPLPPLWMPMKAPPKMRGHPLWPVSVDIE